MCVGANRGTIGIHTFVKLKQAKLIYSVYIVIQKRMQVEVYSLFIETSRVTESVKSWNKMIRSDVSDDTKLEIKLTQSYLQ